MKFTMMIFKLLSPLSVKLNRPELLWIETRDVPVVLVLLKCRIMRKVRQQLMP